jgi:hypothetical protein
MRAAFHPIRKRVPRITHEEAVVLIRRNWMKPDGTLISEEEARVWASTFLFHLRYEVGPIWKPPKPRTRPERPTAERLDRFTQLERDWVRRTTDSVPVRIR